MPEEGTLTSPLDRQLADLPRVGADRAGQLARLKCHTLGDLFLHRPRRHEDRRNIRPIGDLSIEEASLSRGHIAVMGTKRLRGGRTLFEFVLEDDSGTITCRWWNLGYMARYFKTGDDVLIYGKLSKG